MNYKDNELGIIYNYFGIKKRGVKPENLKRQHPEYEHLISLNKKRPRKVFDPQLSKEQLIKNTITKAKFINNWNGARKVIKDFRKYQNKLYFKPKQLINEFEEKLTLEKSDIVVDKDEEELIVQINDVFNLLKLQWNEKTKMKPNDIIYSSNLVLVFEGGVDYFTVSHQLLGLTVDMHALTQQVLEFDTKYNDEQSQNGSFRLRTATLRIYYGPERDNRLVAYGQPKHTKKSVFSPVLYNWYCCLSEVACFLKMYDSDIITKKWYKFQNKRDWGYINIIAVTQDIFSAKLKETFLSGDIKQFVIEWNTSVKKVDVVLYNSVTQEYYPYEPVDQTRFVLFWYFCHVEVFDRLDLPKVKRFTFEKQALTNKQAYQVCTIDFETYKIDDEGTQKPYLICIYSPAFQKILYTLDELMLFFKELSKDHNMKYVFWAHNGMKFDYVFMLPYLVKTFNIRIGGKIGELKSIEFANIKLLDFYKFFNNSLNTLAKTFLNQTKLEFDFTKVYDEMSVKKHLDEATIYCMKDCTLLYDLVMKFNNQCVEEFNIGINDCFSASHLAKQVFQQFYLKDKIDGAMKDDYDIEKSSYHGGMCISYVRGYCKQKIYAYDINSSYPSSMLKKMPFKLIFSGVYDNLPLKDHYLYYVKFEFPLYSRICNLAMKVEDELVFLQKGQGWYWGCELQISLKLNCVLKIEKLRKYKAKQIFEGYILDLYEKRKKAKLDNNAILVELYKRLLNSLYGKFGQKLHHKNYIEKYETFLNKEMKLNNLKLLSDDCLYVEYQDKYQYYNNIGSLVRFSSYISAQSRCTLLEPVCDMNHANVLYMDTDSLFLTMPINEKYMSDTELGKFKCEMYSGAIFICAKNYCLFQHDKLTCKMKGVNKATHLNYLELLDKNVTTIETIQSKKEFGKVQILNIKKIITSHSFKRKQTDYYTLPHFDSQAYLAYKKSQQLLKLKSKVAKKDVKESKPEKLILYTINNSANVPVILNHKDTYPVDINMYLKYRIIGYNGKCLNLKEKQFIYDKIYKKDDVDVRLLLCELYNIDTNVMPNWRSGDIGYFKKALVYLQYKYNKG